MGVGIQKIRNEIDNDSDRRTVCKTLLQIFMSITQAKSETEKEKARKVMLDSECVMESLMPHSGGLEMLFEVGFQEGEDHFFFPISNQADAKLNTAVTCLLGLLLEMNNSNENKNENESESEDVNSSKKTKQDKGTTKSETKTAESTTKTKKIPDNALC